MEFKLYKFNELSKKAKEHAVKDYVDGWNEVRATNDIDHATALRIIRQNNDEWFYTEQGVFVYE